MKKIYLSKASSQVARHNTIRDINKRTVLNYVRARPFISRAEIARQTSLQRSTVSAIVDDLLNENMIEEIGTGDSTGGRRPTRLKLKSGIPCVIGVDVTPRETHILLADLTGDILKRDSFPTSSDVSYMNEQILSRVERLAADNAEYQLEVGISVPGIADQNTARLYIPYFHWLDWDIGKQISQRTGLSVTVDNDANAVALAELWFGETDVKTARNFILVMIAEGIGTGIIIDGQVYRGENGAAGEFGHMFVADDATVDCSCGRRDCWEAHASEKAILDRYLSQNGSADTTGIDIQHVIRLAQNGEKTAISVLKETATYIGIGISNLIMGFSPQSIIIAGSVVKAWDIIKDEIQQLETRSIRQELSIPPIFPSTLGPYPTNLGAISLVLARKFAALGSG